MKGKHFVILGICLIILTLVGAKEYFFEKEVKHSVYFEAEAGVNAPENFIILIDTAYSEAVLANLNQGIVFRNVSAFYKDVSKNIQTILTRIPPGTEDSFKEKPLLTLFSDARFNTYYINADSGAAIAQEAKEQINGPVISVIKELLDIAGRKLIVAEVPGGDLVPDLIKLINNSDKASVLMAAAAGVEAAGDCPSTLQSYIYIYANGAYLADTEHKMMFERLENIKQSPVTLQYIFDTAAALADIHYGTADGLKNLTKINPQALAGKKPEICTF